VVNQERLLNTFLSLVQIDSLSGHEAAIGAELVARLRGLDMRVDVDDVGNVLGRWEESGDYLLLSAHMDTVPPGTGIRPAVRDGVVYADGTTILGSDDKSGIAIILEVLASLREQGRRPALEVALSVSEEIGLQGAKAMDRQWFRSRQALVLDAGGPLNRIVYGAPVSDKFDAVVYGHAAHAGSYPEEGVNAIAVAAKAIANMQLGRIDDETTANVGLIRGGQAVNVVPDLVEIHGEARSHDVAKLDAQIAAMRQALENAVAEQPGARVEVDIRRTYEAYRLSPTEPLIVRICDALADMGEESPVFHLTGGGSDANILNTRGIAAVPISTGMQSVHTTAECIALCDMVRCADLVLRVLDQSFQSESKE
jgi:tripeptide aminopeptidase